MHSERKQELFWQKVRNQNDPDRCWIWTASRFKGKFNYGYFNAADHGSDIVLAHRFSMELHLGRMLLADECVLHECDNPPCVNPHHLIIGDRKKNNNDRETRGRGNHPVGITNGRSKLIDREVAVIRKLYASGDWTQQQLANLFGVSTIPIHQIVTRKTWKHVS